MRRVGGLYRAACYFAGVCAHQYCLKMTLGGPVQEDSKVIAAKSPYAVGQDAYWCWLHQIIGVVADIDYQDHKTLKMSLAVSIPTYVVHLACLPDQDLVELTGVRDRNINEINK